MAYCKKCGAYIPIDETACPACGYDPEEEERKAREAAEEEKRKQAEAARREEEERRRKQEAENWAARERAREEERRRAAQSGNNRRTYGSSQTQYTSQRTGQSGAAQGQYASQRREETWVPPWSQTEEQDRTAGSGAAQPGFDTQMRDRAKESVENQKLSVLSYVWPLALIPLALRGKDDFARYHANQGLVLLVAEGVASMALSILGLESLGFLVGLGGLAGTIKGISNVLRGKKEPLPFIGGINLLK